MRWVKLTLPPRVRPQVAVDDLAVDLEQLGRDAAEAGGRRDLEAGLHVGDDAGARRPGSARRASAPLASARPPASAPRARRGRAGPAAGRRGRCAGWPAAPVGLAGGLVSLPVVGEELLPALAHRRRVGPVLLVHLVDQPRVGPEILEVARASAIRRAYRAPASSCPVILQAPHPAFEGVAVLDAGDQEAVVDPPRGRAGDVVVPSLGHRPLEAPVAVPAGPRPGRSRPGRRRLRQDGVDDRRVAEVEIVDPLGVVEGGVDGGERLRVRQPGRPRRSPATRRVLAIRLGARNGRPTAAHSAAMWSEDRAKRPSGRTARPSGGISGCSS